MNILRRYRHLLSMAAIGLVIFSGRGSAQIHEINWAVDTSLSGYVNPFIGTAGGGNTFPGAVRPWGMVSVSPHTDLWAPSGYVHDEPKFYGFGHVHLSGTGCSDLGSIIVTAMRGELGTDPDTYSCSYTDEFAEPGYYRTTLRDPKLRAEVTATSRCGMTRFTSQQAGDVAIIIDAGRSLVNRRGGMVAFVSGTEVEGYNLSGGFCGEDNKHKVYFVARFSQPPFERGVWTGGPLSGDTAATVVDSSVGAWLRYHAPEGRDLSPKNSTMLNESIPD